MSISVRSYGSTADVATLVPRHANQSVIFDTTTRPTLATVEGQINQVSGILNSMLAEAGFDIPVSQADVKLALDLFVNQEVAAIVEGINGSGRFGPTTKQGGSKGRFTLILDDVKAFIEGNKVGFERMGASRSYDVTSGVGFRDTDEAGDETFPLFQRKAYGDEAFRKDWDDSD